MLYTTREIFRNTLFGVTALARPYEICMELVGAGSILVEIEVGDTLGVWAKIAPAYTVASPAHRIIVARTQRRLRITPSGGARYSISDASDRPPEPTGVMSFEGLNLITADGLIVQVAPY